MFFFVFGTVIACEFARANRMAGRYGRDGAEHRTGAHTSITADAGHLCVRACTPAPCVGSVPKIIWPKIVFEGHEQCASFFVFCFMVAPVCVCVFADRERFRQRRSAADDSPADAYAACVCVCVSARLRA